MEMPAERWQSIDGLVSVGGDGLFNELLSGALLRTQLEAGMNIDDPATEQLQTPHIRFGIIGAGSANSIVSTVHETSDFATAAVHIAIGLLYQNQEQNQFLAFSSGWSLPILNAQAKLALSSRPKIKSLMVFAKCTKHVTSSECNVDVCTVHKQNHLIRISANAISYGWLGDVLRDSERFRWLGPIRYQWSALRTTIRHPIYKGKVQFTLSRKETEDPNKMLPPCTKPDQQICVAYPRYDYHWHAEFTHVICCIGDGTLDLALVPRISRWHNIQFMRKVAMYGGKGLYQLDRTLCCFRVLRWSFEPDADQVDPGVWNLDGEILEQPKSTALHFRLHPRLISFFGRDAAMIE
ncbi:unnamed protein product, partial [Cylicostephanus goldi]